MNEPRSNVPESTDLGAAEAWQVFQVRLAAYLSTMVDPDGSDHLIVELPGHSEADGTAPYAQFAGFGGGMIRAEVTGNDYLAPAYRLDDEQLRVLKGKGWSGADDEELNHFVVAPASEATVLAAMAVSALRDDFEIPHPDLLSMRAWGEAAEAAVILGLRRTEDVPGDVVDGGEPLGMQKISYPHPRNRDDLFGLVRATLQEEYGEEPTVDDDEDFVLEHLGQPVYVRVRNDIPAVEVFARVVNGVYSRRQTALEIALLNRESDWVTWRLRDRDVWQRALVDAQPYVPAQLTSTIGVFRQAMDRTREALALRTRGDEG